MADLDFDDGDFGAQNATWMAEAPLGSDFAVDSDPIDAAVGSKDIDTAGMEKPAGNLFSEDGPMPMADSMAAEVSTTVPAAAMPLIMPENETANDGISDGIGQDSGYIPPVTMDMPQPQTGGSMESLFGTTAPLGSAESAEALRAWEEEHERAVAGRRAAESALANQRREEGKAMLEKWRAERNERLANIRKQHREADAAAVAAAKSEREGGCKSDWTRVWKLAEMSADASNDDVVIREDNKSASQKAVQEQDTARLREILNKLKEESVDVGVKAI